MSTPRSEEATASSFGKEVGDGYDWDAQKSTGWLGHAVSSGKASSSVPNGWSLC